MSRLKGVRVSISQPNATSIGVFLEAMPGAMRNKVLRPMIETLASDGAKRMKRNLKSALASRKRSRKDRWQSTGALMASIGTRRPVKIMKDGNVFGAFGVRRNQSFSNNKLKKVRKRIAALTKIGFRTIKRGEAKLATKSGSLGPNLIKPSRYAHLVERGHRGPIKSKPYPFVKPTFHEMKTVIPSRAPQIIREKWPKVVAAEARRLRTQLKV